jgi:hypothetical protein
MILGSKKFVNKIRKQFLPDIPHNDLPLDIDKCVQARRLHGVDKHKRDLIIYFLWNK